MENLIENTENAPNNVIVTTTTAPEMPETQPKKELLYDASAVQRVPFAISDDDSIEPVILHFAPISDIRYIDYDDACAVRIVDDGKSLSTSTMKPSGNLWDELVTQVENVEFEGENTDWKAAFDLLQFKIPSLNTYLAVSVYEQPKANNGKLVIGSSSERIVYADLFFNGEVVTTKHYLQKMNFEHAKELEKTQKIPLQTKAKGLQETGDYTFPNSVKGKAALYDKMKSRESEGFAGGVVPVRVKAKIVDFIARAQIQQKK